MKPKIGDIKTGGMPKNAPEGAVWVPVGAAHPEKGIHQRWQLREVRTFEQDLASGEISFLVPPELESRGGEQATQNSFLGKLGNALRGIDRE